jgi:hypothetical protein
VVLVQPSPVVIETLSQSALLISVTLIVAPVIKSPLSEQAIKGVVLLLVWLQIKYPVPILAPPTIIDAPIIAKTIGQLLLLLSFDLACNLFLASLLVFILFSPYYTVQKKQDSSKR